MADLTKAQRELLLLTSEGEVDTTWGHPVATELADLGLVVVRRCRPASTYVGGQTATITAAGRAALGDHHA